MTPLNLLMLDEKLFSYYFMSNKIRARRKVNFLTVKIYVSIISSTFHTKFLVLCQLRIFYFDLYDSVWFFLKGFFFIFLFTHNISPGEVSIRFRRELPTKKHGWQPKVPVLRREGARRRRETRLEFVFRKRHLTGARALGRNTLLSVLQRWDCLQRSGILRRRWILVRPSGGRGRYRCGSRSRLSGQLFLLRSPEIKRENSKIDRS